jgi:hypothetical protein
MTPAYRVYEPLYVPKELAEDLWIVDGPEIRFRFAGLRIPFPTRMTLIRLPAGELWVHSPIAPSSELIEAVNRLGRVAHLIAPNSIHYSWLADWAARFPAARVWAVSNVEGTKEGRAPPHHQLASQAPEAWAGTLEQVVVSGSRVMEVEFFHRPSRTLVMTDLIENFEAERFESRFYRFLCRIGGVLHPDGKTPRDLQATFRNNRAEVRAAVRQMLAWKPRQIVIAHGRCYTANAESELRRAFRWIL